MLRALRKPTILQNKVFSYVKFSMSSSTEQVIPEGFEEIVEGQASMIYAKNEGISPAPITFLFLSNTKYISGFLQQGAGVKQRSIDSGHPTLR